MKADRRLLLVLCIKAIHAHGIQAQEVAGSLQGRILDATGHPEADVRVVVSGPRVMGIRAVVTGRDGIFRVDALPPGAYVVRISKIGFRSVALEQVTLAIGRATTLGSIVLTSQPQPLEELVILAPAVTLDPVHTTIGGRFDASDYALLPVERDYKDIIKVLPHVNSTWAGDRVSAGGSTGLENVYFIDGVNVTSPRTAIRGTSLPWNFVRAVEVKVGSYDAQYGRGLGALVNAQTYSGTNQFEANVFGFMTHGELAAEPRAEPTLRERGSVSYDLGARVGGPVVRDRLWYSAAWNPRVERVDREIRANGVFEDRRIAHVFAGKLNWRAGPRTSVEVSLFGDPTVHHAVEVPGGAPTGATVENPDPYLTKRRSGGEVGSLRASIDLGRRVRLEAGLSRSSGREDDLAETVLGSTQSQYLDHVSGIVAGGVRLEQSVRDRRTAASVRGSVTLPRHFLNLGAEYEDVSLSLALHTPGIGLIRRELQFVVDSEYATGSFHNRVPTAYLQDSWQVSDRLSLKAGVRWSAQTLTGASGRTAQRLPGEWQPRLGFVWQPGSPGRQQVIGSWGRFYQQEPLNLPSLWYLCFAWVFNTYSSDPRQPGASLVRRDDLSTCEDDIPRLLDGLEAEYYDEFTLGYERLLGSTTRLTMRGIRRELGSSWQFGFDPSVPCYCVIGTPGKGTFAFLPRPRREYTALELGVEGMATRLRYRGSYVLSRLWGNYTGLFASDLGAGNPGGNFTFAAPDQAVNSTGPLPSDRTHVVKVLGSYETRYGAAMGAFLTWQSGTPINAFGPGLALGTQTPVFLVPRGSAGRTPSIWDVNLRVAYAPPWTRAASRIVLDLLHVGNPREALRLDQYQFRVKGVGNPDYLRPLQFQPPMMARFGLEVSF